MAGKRILNSAQSRDCVVPILGLARRGRALGNGVSERVVHDLANFRTNAERCFGVEELN
jgi:hypothetical protein